MWAISSDKNGEARARTKVKVDSPPGGGEAVASPPNGTALETSFTLASPLTAWTGGERPLTFFWG